MPRRDDILVIFGDTRPLTGSSDRLRGWQNLLMMK